MMTNFVPPLRLQMQMRSQITDFCLIATKNPSLSILIALEILTSIIARLRTGRFKGMKISSDKTRTYIPCKNCTEAQLTLDHILECPALTPHIIRLGMVQLASELHEVLYSAHESRLAEVVQRAHDII
ncbi:hypothetical protein TNCV_1833711 [Trichonephila clavipes]|nr:hypothetical protein TNCV_1833711 [Trichonephila clavipes]